ncbi:hypothetical protein [Leptolyngbya ohadii]|uniref:hypothetical protein n=1 Tax=Leptolyngbya ohadii TaxID=1962290 RepID=UPI000B59BB13|nr:hypothetical protein [Leptolyngbya ohadii]
MLKPPFSRKKPQASQTSLPQAMPHLEQFAQSLQRSLQAQLLHSQLQVRCAVRQEMLFLLIEHLLHVEPDPAQTFANLEAIVRKEVTEQLQAVSVGRDSSGNSSENSSGSYGSRLPVRLFLRIAGHQQPYQSHSFSVPLSDAESATDEAKWVENTPTDQPISPISDADPDLSAMPQPLVQQVDREVDREVWNEGEHQTSEHQTSEQQNSEHEISENETSENLISELQDAEAWEAVIPGFSEGELNATEPNPFSESNPNRQEETAGQAEFSGSEPETLAAGHSDQPGATPMVSPELVEEPEAWSDRKPLLARMSLSTWIFVGAVGLSAAVAGIYALTRPCVIGACPQLQQAQQLSDRAMNTIETTQSALAIVEAHDQLREVDGLLSPIPAWSPHYNQAQQLMNLSEARASRVAQIVSGLRKANEAAQKSQNPPHPMHQWREIQLLWRDAIAALQRVPADSPAYNLAQRRLKEYEASLADINRRVGVEQAAQDRVGAARRTAQVAEAQAGIARTSQDWGQASTAWRATVQALDQIPQGTMAHAEAEQLLALYQPKLQEATQRRQQESIAETSLQQANQLAEKARQFEQNNQWSDAKTAWQEALINLQRIPQETAYRSQVQSRIQSYTAAIAQADRNAVRFNAMRAVQPDLDRLCSGAGAICSYSFVPQAIRVRLSRGYDQTTQQVMTAGQNLPAPTATTTQVSNLLRSLADISQTSQVPVELYSASGDRFGVYSPEVSGFVAQ